MINTEWTHLTGYDVYTIITRWQVKHRIEQLLVVNNNSTHFLVIRANTFDSHVFSFKIEAEYSYADEEDCDPAYLKALAEAYRLAIAP